MIEPMTDEELQACRERAEAATPGPWKVSRVPFDERKGTDEVCDLVNDTWVVTRVGFLRDFRSDAKFIAHAREDVPRLLATIDALRTELTKLSAPAHPWNECEKCGYVLDIGDDAHDGTEVNCHVCGSVSVIEELTDGTFGLYLADFGEEDE
jgi:hypothetical protein